MKKFTFKKQNLEQGAIILMFATLLVKIISAFFKIPLSGKQFLGELGYGYFSVAHDFFAPFYVLAISGLPVAVAHITAEYITQKRYRDVEKNFYITRKLFVIFGIVFAVIISLLAVPIVHLTDPAGNTLYSVLAIVPSIFLCFLISVYRGYYEGFRIMYPTAISEVIEAVCKLVLGLSFAYIVKSYTHNPAFAAASAMWGITIGTVLSAVYLHFSFVKNRRNLISSKSLKASPKAYKGKKTVKIILMLAIPMALSSLASSAVALIDVITVRLIITANLSEFWSVLKELYNSTITSYNAYAGVDLTAQDLPTFLYGIRSKAYTLYNLVPTLTMAFGVGALPVLTECWVKKDISGVKSNLNTMIKLVSLICLPAGIGYIAVSKPIMVLLYSETSASVNMGGNMLALYGISAIAAGFAIPFTSILQSVDKQITALINIVIGIALKLLVNVCLISIVSVNIYGAVIGTAVCYLYILVAHIISLHKTMGSCYKLKESVLNPLFAAVCSGVSAYLICLITNKKIVIAFAILVAVLVYAAILLLTKTLTEEDISSLPMGKKIFNFGKKIKIFK